MSQWYEIVERIKTTVNDMTIVMEDEASGWVQVVPFTFEDPECKEWKKGIHSYIEREVQKTEKENKEAEELYNMAKKTYGKYIDFPTWVRDSLCKVKNKSFMEESSDISS